MKNFDTGNPTDCQTDNRIVSDINGQPNDPINLVDKFNEFHNGQKYQSKFRPEGEIKLPAQTPPLFWVIENDQIETLARSGSLVIITSKAKAGKTGLLGALMAGAIRKPSDFEVDTLGINVAPCPPNKFVIHIDTESSEYDYCRNLLAVTERTQYISYLPKHLKTIGLRTVKLDERWELIEILVEEVAKLGGIHAIFLDGLTDLLPSINDETVAIYTCERLLTIADKYQTAIVSVIHENQKATSGGGARGWLGSQLERKVSAHISITKNEDGTRAIEFQNCRECNELTPRLFEWCKEKLRFVSCGIGQIKRSGRPVSKFDETEIEEMKSLRESGLSYTEIGKKFNVDRKTIQKYMGTLLK